MSNVWVVGASSLAEDDVSRMFPKFVFGSFVESFGVSPSGELLGLGEGGTRPSHQNGVGLWAQRDILGMYSAEEVAHAGVVLCSVSLYLLGKNIV
jgi:hypothetical protein